MIVSVVIALTWSFGPKTLQVGALASLVTTSTGPAILGISWPLWATCMQVCLLSKNWLDKHLAGRPWQTTILRQTG